MAYFFVALADSCTNISSVVEIKIENVMMSEN
jgi:hypothetical protein